MPNDADVEDGGLGVDGSDGSVVTKGNESKPAKDIGGGQSGDSSAADGLTWLKESITSSLAAAIAIVALVLLWRTFTAAGRTGSSMVPIFGRDKDVLQYILPVLGTVVGYYFGRVPAERRAEKAEQSATGAQKQAASLQESAAQTNADRATAEALAQQVRADTKATVVRIRSALIGMARLAPGENGAPEPNMQLALAELNALEDRLNS